MILVLFPASALFWAGFEQMGSSFNLLPNATRNGTGSTSIFQQRGFKALGPVFIIVFAPVFAWLWVWLARRQLDPSIPMKFARSLCCCSRQDLSSWRAQQKLSRWGTRPGPLITTPRSHSANCAPARGFEFRDQTSRPADWSADDGHLSPRR